MRPAVSPPTSQYKKPGANLPVNANIILFFTHGELSEWSKVQHSKCCVRKNPGFESLTLRHACGAHFAHAGLFLSALLRPRCRFNIIIFPTFAVSISRTAVLLFIHAFSHATNTVSYPFYYPCGAHFAHAGIFLSFPARVAGFNLIYLLNACGGICPPGIFYPHFHRAPPNPIPYPLPHPPLRSLLFPCISPRDNVKLNKTHGSVTHGENHPLLMERRQRQRPCPP